MTTIGKIDVFDETQESWETYVERVQHFFAANDVDDEHKVPTLLSLIGSKTYSLLKDLLLPEKPADKNFEEIVSTLQKHLNPKPLEIAERFRFYKRNQQEGESVLSYVAELKKLTTHCNFGGSLEETLRDKLVCGLNNQQIQKRLLAEPKLKFSKAVDIAVAMETATRDATEIYSELREGKPLGLDKLTLSRPSNRPDNSPPSSVVCYRCGANTHVATECRFKKEVCHKCGKRGHIQRVCRTQQGPSQASPRSRCQKSTHAIEKESDEYEDLLNNLEVHNVNKSSNDVIWVNVNVENQPLSMELDTGSAVSILPYDIFLAKFRDKKLEKTSTVLRTYTGEQIVPVGCLTVQVEHLDQSCVLPLHVVHTKGPVLMGRNWLHKLRLDWKTIKLLKTSDSDHENPCITTQERLESLLDTYAEVFEDKLGTFKSAKAKITLKEGSQPQFRKARQVPYSLRPKVEEELKRLESEGILSKVEWSDWATPIVPVPKQDGSVRICGDFKGTINPALQAEQYPLPRIEDIFANLAGGKKFSKIDLRQAYHQIELEEESRKYLTINTSMGLFQYNRLVFGITSAPAIWQRTMDQILEGTSGISCILDDMIVTGESDADHLANLEEVLRRLHFHGLRANKSKCEFFQEKITFCGHDIDSKGLHKTTDKTAAVVNAPRPQNVTEVRSFLGLVNYYHKFLPNLATTLHPLNQMLESNYQWDWTDRCEEAFQKVKVMIASDLVLTHYDPKLPLQLACDASPVGIGAVLSHVMPDGTERPIAFASRSLSKAERNYAQIDKEALATVWGVKKFHNYLFGRNFTLLTDHEPLTSIFHPSKSLPAVTAARLQRYALFLAGFDYTIMYKNTKCHGNADGLSRLPLHSETTEESDPVGLFYSTQFEPLPVTAEQVKRETQRDPLLVKVHDLVMKGWAIPQDEQIKPFYQRKDELTVHCGVLMLGHRVVIPVKLRNKVLSELHEGHLGIVKMKSLARSYIWWPKIDKDIEHLAKSCPGCQLQQNEAGKVSLHPWEWPTAPWQRIHLDFAGPFLGRMFLVIVDAHSKWPEVEVMSSTTSTQTIDRLRTIFGRYGVPAQVVTDNGPQFTSTEFQLFLKTNGIKHITTAPFHPATNGQAERFVQSFKRAMKCEKQSTSQLNTNMAKFLLAYRNTAHSTTGEAPSVLFLGRPLRTRLDLVKPDLLMKVKNRQLDQVRAKEHASTRQLSVGQTVMARNYTGKDKWLPGTVQAKTGPLSYEIKIGPDRIWRRHIDQLRASSVKLNEPSDDTTDIEREEIDTAEPRPDREDTDQNTPAEDLIPEPDINPERTAPVVQQEETNSAAAGFGHRYPSRSHQPPERLGLNWLIRKLFAKKTA